MHESTKATSIALSSLSSMTWVLVDHRSLKATECLDLVEPRACILMLERCELDVVESGVQH